MGLTRASAARSQRAGPAATTPPTVRSSPLASRSLSPMRAPPAPTTSKRAWSGPRSSSRRASDLTRRWCRRPLAQSHLLGQLLGLLRGHALDLLEEPDVEGDVVPVGHVVDEELVGIAR